MYGSVVQDTETKPTTSVGTPHGDNSSTEGESEPAEVRSAEMASNCGETICNDELFLPRLMIPACSSTKLRVSTPAGSMAFVVLLSMCDGP
jgi:hypothetical protein